MRSFQCRIAELQAQYTKELEALPFWDIHKEQKLEGKLNLLYELSIFCRERVGLQVHEDNWTPQEDKTIDQEFMDEVGC